MSSRHRWWAAATVIAAVLATAASRAGGQAVPPADQQRLAGGEVKFAGQWTAVADLFEQYRAVRKEIDDARIKDKAARDRIAEINRAVAQIQDEWRKHQDAIEIDLGKNQTKQQKALAHLAMPVPPKPTMEAEPAEPSRADFKDNLSYSTARNNWLRDRERVQTDNQRRQQIYNNEMDRYQEMQQRGKAALEEANAAVEDCTKRLEDAYFVRKGKEKGLIAERGKLTDEQAARAQAIGGPITKAAAMADALRTAPESVRLAKGIVQWREQFYAVAELQRKLERLTAEIADARKQAEERATRAGGTLAKEWRHPKQDDADELRTLIERIKPEAKAP